MLTSFIPTPVGTYIIQTSREHLYTSITLEIKEGTFIGPIPVSIYDNVKDAQEEHLSWQASIMEHPMTIFRDVRNGDITFIDEDD